MAGINGSAAGEQTAPRPPLPNGFWAVLHGAEKYLSSVVVALLVAVPVIETALRVLKIPGLEGIPDAEKYVRYFVLLLTFLGGMIVTRERQHLTIGVLVDNARPPWGGLMRFFNAAVSACVCTALGLSAVSLLAVSVEPGASVGFIPVFVLLLVLPVGYLVMGVRFVTRSGLSKRAKLFAFSGLLLGVAIALPSLAEVAVALALGARKTEVPLEQLPEAVLALHRAWYGAVSVLWLPALVCLVLSAFTGTPLFIVLGGAALLLFGRDFPDFAAGSLSSVPNAVYSLLIGENIPAIPLFAFTGFLLARSRAGERLMRLFRALFGFLPGGIVVMVVMVSAFFTTFTGASGVTILALGSVLYSALSQEGRYSGNFSVGLLTASGSIGLLFPPSLPLILYGSIAHVSIIEMFKNGILPGLLMVLVLSLAGIVATVRERVAPVPFRPREVLRCLKESAWELVIPVFIVVPFFLGFTKFVEMSAFIVLYTLFVETVVRREIRWRDLPDVALKGVIVIGGILVVIGAAQAFADYIILQEIPMRLAAWMAGAVKSPLVFLFFLNLALLVVGCFMDMYAALVVVVPFIIPLGETFGVDPVHLGIIFIVNLEIGFLTPPVGLNLFLSSYCFGKPIGEIYRAAFPFFFLQIGVLFLVTYAPYAFAAVRGLLAGAP